MSIIIIIIIIIFDIGMGEISCMTGTGPSQHRSRPGKDSVFQDKGKFGKLGGVEVMQCCLRFHFVFRGQDLWPKCYDYHFRLLFIIY